MAGDALLRDLGQRSYCTQRIPVGARLLRHKSELTGRLVHLSSDVLHRLGHEGRHVRSPVRLKRRQADSSFGNVSGSLIVALAEGLLNFSEGE